MFQTGIVDPTNSIANIFRLTFMPEDVVMGTWEAIVGPMVDVSGCPMSIVHCPLLLILNFLLS